MLCHVVATGPQSKLLGLQAVCPTSGCDSVLNSAYAQLFGLPLPLFGAAAYGGVAAVAAAAAALRGKRQEVPGALDSALFAGSTLLATCSATLMCAAVLPSSAPKSVCWTV